MMSNPNAIQRTLVRLVRPGTSPKDLFMQTRKAHPKASRKEIVLAAFASMIELADHDPKAAQTLQSVGIDERIGTD